MNILHSSKIFQRNFHLAFARCFSTLIVPQIIHKGANTNIQKLHSTTYNVLNAAKQLQDKDIHLILYSSGAHKLSDELVKEAKSLTNIKKIFTFYYPKEDLNLNEISPEIMSSLVAQINKIKSYEYILAPANTFGKGFIPRLGALLNVQPISEISKIEEGKNIFNRFVYAGNAINKVSSQQKPNVLTVRIASFEPEKLKRDEPNIEVIDLSKNEEIKAALMSTRSSKFIQNYTIKTDKVDLTEAKFVIAGGRAIRTKDQFKMIEELASLFEHSAIGATRAAIDAGFAPHGTQIGQTGKIISPDLLITIGISGAIQFVAGIKDSKVIVAINSDADSLMFGHSTYYLVGEELKILPELIEKIRKVKSSKM